MCNIYLRCSRTGFRIKTSDNLRWKCAEKTMEWGKKVSPLFLQDGKFSQCPQSLSKIYGMAKIAKNYWSIEPYPSDTKDFPPLSAFWYRQRKGCVACGSGGVTHLRRRLRDIPSFWAEECLYCRRYWRGFINSPCKKRRRERKRFLSWFVLFYTRTAVNKIKILTEK